MTSHSFLVGSVNVDPRVGGCKVTLWELSVNTSKALQVNSTNITDGVAPRSWAGQLEPRARQSLGAGAGLQELDSHPLGQEEHTLGSFTRRKILLLM